ncbi:MAG: HAMP domain-containing protein [Anaerolineaceae bacterium]|nr:HAMP domain-containing protein [Anaerolineaceae bacterium]
MAQRILIVQPYTESAHSLARLFVPGGDDIHIAWDLGQAVIMLNQLKPGLLFFDLNVNDPNWLEFLKNAHRLFPDLGIVLTSTKMDVKREMDARELGLNVFWRAPFSKRWLPKILQQLKQTPGSVQGLPASQSSVYPGPIVRLPIRHKIILPYLLLVVGIVVAFYFIFNRLIFDFVPNFSPAAFWQQTSTIVIVEICILLVLGLLLIVLIGVSLGNLITRPIVSLVKATSKVAEGDFDIKVDVKGRDEIALLSQSFNHMVAGLQEGSIYRDVFGRTVPAGDREQLRSSVSTGKLRFEGQETTAAVLYSNIRGFSAISDKADPTTIFKWLNDYYSCLVPVITSHGGVVNKFDGEAILAFFGIMPKLTDPDESALQACMAALEMVKAVQGFNEDRVRRGDPVFLTGIAVNTGAVMAGGLGSADRLHYTILGDTVNTAQRLEGLTRQLLRSTGVLVSHSVLSSLAEKQSEFHFESMGMQVVKGRADRIQIYQLHPRREFPPLTVML